MSQLLTASFPVVSLFPQQEILETEHAGSVVVTVDFNPDAGIIQNIEEVLCRSGYPALRQIQVESCAGVITLLGRVPTYHQKQLAQSLVWCIPGVESLVNELDVNGYSR